MEDVRWKKDEGKVRGKRWDSVSITFHLDLDSKPSVTPAIRGSLMAYIYAVTSYFFSSAASLSSNFANLSR